MKIIILLGLFLWVMTGCGTISSSGDANAPGGSAAGEQKQIEISSAVKDTPEFRNAELFDRWIHGALSPDEVAAAKKECRAKSNQNLFCPAFQNGSLANRIKVKLRIPKTPEIKVVTATPIEISGSKIKNLKKIRKEKVPPLLKGLAGASMDDLRKMAKLAQKEKRCPNNVLVAVAATMEDYLPNQITSDEIAPLYESAARCFPKHSLDRENFLTRAGLLYVYKNDYVKAEKLFSKTTAIDAFSGRTLYWLYRSRKELGKTADADKALLKLLEQHRFSFHAILAGLLAGKDAAADYFANSATAIAVKRSPKNKKLNQFIEAIEALHQYRFSESGNVLADWTSDWFMHMEPTVRIYLAEMGDPALQVSSIPALLLHKPSLIQRETMELAYPKAYFSSFEKQATIADPLLLLALARKESLFDPKAVSPTNAQGLLQIQPETARKLISDSATAGPPDLQNPETNITLGAKYIAQLIERENGNLLLALGAYNAGEIAVQNWGKRYPTTDLILFVDLIPYRETRDYVTTVLANYYWYTRGYGAPGADPIKKIASELAKK